ncbi:MAG TPA: 50S ribosomal protein L24 [Polyangiaceae bacterium]
MAKLKAGDQVIVIRGEDKGRRGKISRVLPDRGMVVVEGVNQVKRHVKATPQRPGGILEVEAPLDASKVQLIDPDGGKATRVKFKIENGKKVRIAKSGATLPEEQR